MIRRQTFGIDSGFDSIINRIEFRDGRAGFCRRDEFQGGMIGDGRGVLDLHDRGPGTHPKERERIRQTFSGGEVTRQNMILFSIRIRRGEVDRTQKESDQKRDEPRTGTPGAAM
jgi:hypothetical protein